MSRGRGTPRMTRKHLAKAQRDRILSRWIIGGAIAIGVAVFGLLAFAFFGVPILEERQPIATINGEVVTVRDFKARVRLIQLSMINEFQYAQNILQIYADEPSISAFYQQRIEQLSSELDNPGLQGQRALEGMINEILIRQEANSRGIFVTREEVDDAVAVKDFNYYAEGTPTPQPSPTARPSPTAQPSPTADPTAQATTTPSPTPTEVEAQPSATPSSDATPISSPTPIPTATPYTEEAFLAAYGVQMEFLAELGIREEDYLTVTEGELYLERLMAEVEQELAREEDQVWLRHILVEEADEARSVLQRLADGEIWEDLAAELSLDDLTKNDGGDLGWLASQDLAADYGNAFAIVAFATEIDDTAGPLETESGWHAIQILGHEVRTLSDFDFEQRLQDAFDDLLEDLRTEGEVEVDEDWPDYIPHPSELARQVLE
jgi:peptidyl-prolyl cis-trans isomerase D